MFDFLENMFLNRNRYRTHSEAVVVSCFYNPLNSPYRLVAFQKWYQSIKHLNYRIIECLIGEGAKPQLPTDPNIARVHTNSVLWHKESLLNKIVSELPERFKYVFWFDADVLLTNNDWLPASVEQLQTAGVVQPFEYCIHLNRNQTQPDFNVDAHRATVNDPARRHPQMWRSFCATHVQLKLSGDLNYDRHGHVGFAWGARREVLDRVPLYDKALIGGSDHILAHAAAGQIPHPCIAHSFKEVADEVWQWSHNFYRAIGGAPDRIGYVPGDLYHIWHGEVADRQYLRRIRDFMPQAKKIWKKDRNGLWKSNNPYIRGYYRQREATQIHDAGFHLFAAGFQRDMGYDIHDIHHRFGRPAFEKQFEQPLPDHDAAAGGGDWEQDRADDAAAGGGDWDQARQNQGDSGPGNVPAGDVPRPAGDDGPDRANDRQPDSGDASPSAGQLSENFS